MIARHPSDIGPNMAHLIEKRVNPLGMWALQKVDFGDHVFADLRLEMIQAADVVPDRGLMTWAS